jgi:uncharacterized membrane protein YecN with MAPEG domain
MPLAIIAFGRDCLGSFRLRVMLGDDGQTTMRKVHIHDNAVEMLPITLLLRSDTTL